MSKDNKPKTLDQFFGQKKIKQIIEILLSSSKKRGKVIDHILFHGSPGFGKTTLATIIANELGAKIHYAQGPLIDKKADVLSLFGAIKKGDIIFIDEIHGINKNVEELLYSALEEKVIDVHIGPEGDTKIVRMKLPHFTCIGATTKMGKISIPLKDRFGIQAKLEKYSDKEISQIIKNSFKIEKYKIEKDLPLKISPYSNNTPRIAKNLVQRIIDYSAFKEAKIITEKIVVETFETLGLYRYGLNDIHIAYLKCLEDNFYERFASLETLSSLLLEEKSTIEKLIEPILLENKLIEKGARGRKLTTQGTDYLTTYNLNNHL